MKKKSLLSNLNLQDTNSEEESEFYRSQVARLDRELNRIENEKRKLLLKFKTENCPTKKKHDSPNQKIKSGFLKSFKTENGISETRRRVQLNVQPSELSSGQQFSK